MNLRLVWRSMNCFESGGRVWFVYLFVECSTHDEQFSLSVAVYEQISCIA